MFVRQFILPYYLSASRAGGEQQHLYDENYIIQCSFLALWALWKCSTKAGQQMFLLVVLWLCH